MRYQLVVTIFFDNFKKVQMSFIDTYRKQSLMIFYFFFFIFMIALILCMLYNPESPITLLCPFHTLESQFGINLLALF